MMLDGEWRVSFIKNEHPELQYGTAPMPVDDAKQNLYGAGYINGTIIGIPKSGKNREQAWELVKYLTTNDHALGAVLERDPERPVHEELVGIAGAHPGQALQHVLEDLHHPKSTTTPITPIGADHLQTFTNFFVKWYSGKVKDLGAGLRNVDKTIDEKIAAGREGWRQHAVT